MRAISRSTGRSSSTAARSRAASCRARNVKRMPRIRREMRTMVRGQFPAQTCDAAWASCPAESPAVSAGTAGLSVKLLDFFDLRQQLLRSVRDSPRRSARSADQDMSRTEASAPHFFAQIEIRGSPAANATAPCARSLASFHALGDFDLAFAGEQRDRAHLAQVHAHGIVGLVAGIRRTAPDRQSSVSSGFLSNSSFGSSRISTPRSFQIRSSKLPISVALLRSPGRAASQIVEGGITPSPCPARLTAAGDLNFSSGATGETPSACAVSTYCTPAIFRARCFHPVFSRSCSSSASRKASGKFPDRSASLTRAFRAATWLLTLDRCKLRKHSSPRDSVATAPFVSS